MSLLQKQSTECDFKPAKGKYGDLSLARDSDVNFKEPLVSVAASGVRWLPFAKNRYGDLEDLDLVASWAIERARARA